MIRKVETEADWLPFAYPATIRQSVSKQLKCQSLHRGGSYPHPLHAPQENFFCKKPARLDLIFGAAITPVAVKSRHFLGHPPRLWSLPLKAAAAAGVAIAPSRTGL